MKAKLETERCCSEEQNGEGVWRKGQWKPVREDQLYSQGVELVELLVVGLLVCLAFLGFLHHELGHGLVLGVEDVGLGLHVSPHLDSAQCAPSYLVRKPVSDARPVLGLGEVALWKLRHIAWWTA